MSHIAKVELQIMRTAFHLSTDVAQKMIYGHFTMNIRIVHKPTYVFQEVLDDDFQTMDLSLERLYWSFVEQSPEYQNELFVRREYYERREDQVESQKLKGCRLE